MSKMVAAPSLFTGSPIQHASSRSVVAYDETSPNATRIWATAVQGSLNSLQKGVLKALTEPTLTIERWMKREDPVAKTRESAGPTIRSEGGLAAISGGMSLRRPVARRRGRLAPDPVHGMDNASR